MTVFLNFMNLEITEVYLFSIFQVPMITSCQYLPVNFMLWIRRILAFSTKLTFLPTFPAEERVASISIATSAGENKPI